MKRLSRGVFLVGSCCFLVLALSAAAGSSSTDHGSTKKLPRLSAVAPPTKVSSRYVVAGAPPYPTLRAGNTVYVGGVSQIAPPTGSGVILATASRQALPATARVAGGSVEAAIADSSGGWYLGGSFTSIGGVPRAGLAHLLAGGTLDASFAPSNLGQVTALALDAGRLYVGGVQPLAAAPWFRPVLSVVDAATGAVLPVSYPPLANSSGGLLEVVAIAAGDGRLFAAFNQANGIAAYDETSGTLLWSRSVASCECGRDTGPSALVVAGGRLLVGGQMYASTGRINFEELDPATGTAVGQPAVDGWVTAMAAHSGTAYLVTAPPSGGSVWRLDISSGTLTRLAHLKLFGAAIATDGTTLYLANKRVYALNLGQSKPNIRPLTQVTVGGDVHTLALQGGHLFVGGSFLGMGGVKRSGLAAFDARTGALLPWRPKVHGNVLALAHSGRTIYLAGVDRVAGKRRDGLAAVSAVGTGKLLPWYPRLSRSSMFSSLAVADGRVFVGGLLWPWSTKPPTHLSTVVEFSATTGRQLTFDPKPRIDHVQALAVWHDLLLVGGSEVSAYRLQRGGHTVWSHPIADGNVPIVFALQTNDDTLYVGGRFDEIGGRARTNLAALALARYGRVLSFAPQIPNQVMALAKAPFGLVFSTMALNGEWWLGTQALGAVSRDGQLLPWRVDYPPTDGVVSIESLATVPGGLIASGMFSWIGPTDSPAPGNLVWLH